MTDEGTNTDPFMKVYQESLNDASKYFQFVGIWDKLHKVSLTGLSVFHESVRGMSDVTRSMLVDVTLRRMAAGSEYDSRFVEQSPDDTPPPTQDSVDNLSKVIAHLMERGDSFHRRGRYQDAIECFDKVVFINPAHPEAWNNKGLSFDRLARQALGMGDDHKHEGEMKMREAIACFDKATGGMKWLL